MSDRITIQICRFDIPSKSAGKLINKESVKNVINSDRFKQNLAKGRVLSLLSHADRYAVENKDIPYEDQILVSKYLAGYGKRAWIDESKNAFFGEIELANNENGKLVKDMLKKGFDLSTSMSVSATADDKYYYVEDILSLGDFTTRPDLEAKVIKIDFSEKSLRNGTNLVTFSQRIPNKNVICSFNELPGETTETEDSITAATCPICENDLDQCTCYSSKYKVGVYSESTSRLVSPKSIDSEPKVDINKAKPVDNTQVPANESVITNLDTGVAGVAVSPLFCSIGLNPEIVNTNISIEEIHKDIPVEDQMTIEDIARFPSVLSSTIQASVTNNFSIRDVMREWKLPPVQVLRMRINDVIQICRSSKQEWIDMNLDKLRAYFDSYMLTWVNTIISTENTKFDIGMGLRLFMYGVTPRSMSKLNRAIKRMKQNVETSGFISKMIQQELNNSYQEIENQLYQYINKKISPKTFLTKEEATNAGKNK